MASKSPKKRQEIDIENKYIFEHNFSLNFHRFCRTETLKITILFRKTNDFQKIIVFWKTTQKSIFAFILASQNFPKSLQNQKKKHLKTKIRVNMRVRNFFSRPQRDRSSPQRTPPRKPSPGVLQKVIHLPKYLISTPSFIHWPFLGRPNQSLSPQYLPKIFPKSFQNLPKILSKSCQKSFQNHPETPVSYTHLTLPTN